MEAAQAQAAGAWLSYAVGDRRFLLPAEEVNGVYFCAEQQLYPLPLPDSRVEGLINLNGSPTPVLRASGYSAPPQPGAGQVYLALSCAGRCFALRAEQPLRVLAMAEGSPEQQLSAAELLRAVLSSQA